MFRRKQNHAGANEPRRNTLSELLASEGQLESRLAQARSEADRLVREATAYAEDVERACAKTIEERIAAIRAQAEAEFERSLGTITADATRETAQLDQVDAQQMEELVRLVLARLVGADETQTGAVVS